MTWPADGRTFIPNATGMVFNPLEMPPDEADALLGKEVMDAMREASERIKNSGVNNQYIRIVPVKEKDDV